MTPIKLWMVSSSACAIREDVASSAWGAGRVSPPPGHPRQPPPPPAAARGRAPAPAEDDPPEAAELRQVLAEAQGDVAAAADTLGISVSQLYRRARKYRIRPAHFRP